MINSFLFNNVEVRLVGTDPDTHLSFYVNDGHGGVFGVRVYPNEQRVLVNPDMIKWPGKHGKAVYLQFRNAWGCRKYILASHAVHIAWVGPIRPGMTIDHINGCSTDNRSCNLRQVDLHTNLRDGGFLRKLRNKGIDPTRIDKPYLLRYYRRMALLKETLSQYRYVSLTKSHLNHVLYDGDFDAECFTIYYFKLCKR